MRERTLRISSGGKTFSCTGWKVGWATGPAPLVSAVAKVLSEAARAEAQAQADRIATMQQALLHAIDGAAARGATADRAARQRDAESVRTELATLLGALQSGIVDRLEQASGRDAQALRAALSSGFDRVGDRVAEALRTELTRLEVSLLERLPRAADGTVIDEREQLLATLEKIGAQLTATLDRSFAAMRTTLAETAHDGRAAADGVQAILGQGLEPLRAEVTAMTERVAQRMAELRTAVTEAAGTERSLTAAQVERLRVQIEASLGGLESAYRGHVDALQAPSDKATAAVEAASMARALEATTIHDEIAAGLAAVGDRVDQLARSLTEVEQAQADLRRLVGQLWGEEPTRSAGS
jgi:hypothetical protein